MTFPERLKELRKEEEMTQKELSNKTGISKQMILNYEKNKSDPTSVMICSFADFFEVSTDYLLGRTDRRTYDKPR